MKEGDYSKLPRVVGIFMDSRYPKQEWVHTLVLKVRPKTVITTITGSGMDSFLERLSILRGDIYFKQFVLDEWEYTIKGKAHANKLQDYMFLSYLKFNRGHLFLFPAKYDTRAIGFQKSRRMQDLMITAYKMKIPYDIISVENTEEENT